MQRSYHFEFQPLSCADFVEALGKTLKADLTGDAPVKLSYFCHEADADGAPGGVLLDAAVPEKTPRKESEPELTLGEALKALEQNTGAHPAFKVAPVGRFRAKLKLRGVWNVTQINRSPREDVIRWAVTLTGHPPVEAGGIKSRGALVLRITVDYEDRRLQTVADHGRFANSIRALHEHVRCVLGLKEQRVLQLALSGGGLRATFFHAGVFLALRDMGLLQQLHSISSVSGGTLLAAHLALHWSDYSAAGAVKGRGKALKRLQELRREADSDLRGRAMLKALVTLGLISLTCLLIVLLVPWLESDHKNLGGWLLLPWVFLQVAFIPLTSWFLQCRFVRFLGGEKTLRAVKKAARPGSGQRGVPDCYFTCTDMAKNSLCAHTLTGFIRDVLNDKGEHEHRAFDPGGADELPGNAVYASAAYPVLWPFRKTDSRGKKRVLADGGLSDNTGLEQLMSNALFNNMPGIQLPPQPVACVIASDAATAVKVDAESWSHLVLHKRVPLAVNVMMEIRSRSTIREARQEFKQSDFELPRIDYQPPANSAPCPLAGLDFAKWALAGDIGSSLSKLRTDFNRFDPATTLLLIRWGYVQAVGLLFKHMNRNNGKADGDFVLRDQLLGKPVMIQEGENVDPTYLRDCLQDQCTLGLHRRFLNLLPTRRAWISSVGLLLLAVIASHVLVMRYGAEWVKSQEKPFTALTP